VRVQVPLSPQQNIFIKDKTLKIETTPQEDHQVKVIAEFEADVFDSFKKRAARKIAKKVKIAGFRPGKAPYEIILRHVGEGTINEEAIEILIDEQYAKVLEEAAVEPAGPGSLEEVISIDPPKFSFIVPLKPEVEIGDYASIRLDYAPEPVSEEEIYEFIKRMQKNYATAEPVERPIEKGDLVYYKLSAVEDSESEGAAPIIDDRPFQTIVGDNLNSKEYPYEGFDENLLGMSEGQEKTIEHSFPEDFDDADFQGKNIIFTVNIQSIKSLVLPELNDEFAISLGHFDSYEDLLNGVKEQLEFTKKQEYEDKYYTDVLAKIAEQANVKYPPFMVQDEINHILESVENDLKQQKLDFETYLKLLQTDRKQYIENNVRPAAESRLRNSLIVEKFAQLEKIEIGKDDMDSIMHETSHMLQANNDMKGKKARYSKEQINSATFNAMNRLYSEKTMERLKKIASGEMEKEEQEKLKTELAAEKTEPADLSEPKQERPAKVEKAAAKPKKPRTPKKVVEESKPEEIETNEPAEKKKKRKTKNDTEQT